LLPTAALQGRYTRNENEIAFDLGGASVTMQEKDQYTGTASVNVPLLVPPAYPGLSAAKHGRKASEATFEATTADVLLATAQAYFAAASTDELLAARREAIAVTQRTRSDAKVRLEAGAASPVDVTRAELAVVQAEQAVTEAADARESAYRALSTLVQLREPFTVAPASRDAAALGDVEALTQRALRTRPELRALDETALAFDAQAKSHAWRWAPTVSAFGTATQTSAAGLGGDESTWIAGIQLDWSLFDGGSRDADRRRAESQRREAEAQRERARDAIADAVADDARAVETRRSAVAAAERGVALADQTLGIVRTQYEAGAAAQIELLQAQDDLVNARVSLAQARFDLSVADLQLRRSVGEFPGPVAAR
ncbi:MAG TPA: TolC family protein, partial [Anaeromyxobacteraceae bacterium]|nr:TolC family protein [Anaeromyxobacteraceae bacterium]